MTMLVQRAPFALALILIALAFWDAVQVTQDLSWPPTDELLRDTGLAQAILDGQGDADAHIPGEVSWNNPAVPWLVAQTSALSGLPLPEVYAKAGPYLNLLGPLGLFLLVFMLSEQWTALIALAAYLFLANPQQTALHQATYSAWPWSWAVAQGMFFFSTCAILHMLRRQTWVPALLSGLLLGLTLLVDTVPAFLLVVFLCVAGGFFAWRTTGGAERRRILVLCLLTLLIALAVTAPFVWPLLQTYGFQIRNSVPTQVLAVAPGRMADNLLGLRPLVFFLSMIALWLFPGLFGLPWRRILELRVLLSTMAGLLLLSLVLHGIRLAGLSLPQFFPLHFFYLYYRIAETIVFGAGMLMLARTLMLLFVRELPPRLSADPRPVVPVLLILMAMMLSHGEAHRQRLDFTGYRQMAMDTASDEDTVALYHWILDNAATDAVFLADGRARMAAVTPSGRKVLVHDPVYTSPFVDAGERSRAESELLAFMRQGDEAGFNALAEQYQVRYLILPAALKPCCSPETATRLGLSQVYENPQWRIYRR
ncbi:hypothetical protein Q4485_01035 [Granulosicoccaceae sp. 1_MG-2023]|nr:hypothetical protein [Granulosicoccaceae sp. 1_MG-2023]